MAKAKKKESLTPEERLQAALVPESEQPYPVPANWCWTRIGDILRLQAGKNISASKISKNRSQEASFPCFGGNGVRGYVERYNHDGEFPIIGRQGALCGNVNWASGKFYATEHAVVVECSSIISKRWAYRILFSMNLNQYATATAQPGLSVAVINQVPIALPPAQEQQRIVDRIESLFAKLDEAKQKAQDALDSFETRKAAVLHKAFTGELTAQWRKEHGVGMESWDYPQFEDCILKMQNGLSKRSGNSGVPFVVLRLANLSDDGFVTDDLREILLNEKEQKNYSLRANDVLMIRVNGSKDNVGKQFLFYGELKWAFCDHIIRITYKTNLSPKYMVYFSKTNAYRRYIEDNMVSSAGQNTISRKGMASLIIPLPLMNEQAEIVRILDDLLAKEQQAKEAAEGVLEQIDLMKKAILARAFRGELGTNDPREESAVELLKQVL